MLEYFLTVGNQILIMFLMIVVGYFMAKANMMTERGTKEMSVVLMKVVVPMIIISSFQREFETGLFVKWIIMFLVSALTYAVQIILVSIVYRNKDAEGYAESKLGVVLPNNGFLAFPLMQALVGDIGIFLGATNVIILTILQWTYGVKLFRPNEKISIKKIVLNPGMIAVILGLILFVSPIKLPTPVFKAVDTIGSMNTPLAMIVLGGLMAQSDLKNEIKKLCYYKLSFLKLVAIPVIMVPVLLGLPLSPDIRLIAFICCVTPTATSVSMMSQIYDGDYKFATLTVVITTLISAVTMPVILALGKGIIGY